MPFRSIQDIPWPRLRRKRFHPSPTAWEDQVFYFLLVDRFSDGNEKDYLDSSGKKVETGKTPRYQPHDFNSAIKSDADAAKWRAAGQSWCGGTLNGLASKLGYLKRLGVTALWISPIFKQVCYEPTYHGYGIQNFLAIDPHFGTTQDLQTLVKKAHKLGLYVILDIIVNHAGNVFSYQAAPRLTDPDLPFEEQPYGVAGFHDQTGAPTLPFNLIDLKEVPDAWPDGAVWPQELQNPAGFSCNGSIRNWDYNPEYLRGDFYDLKDFHLGSGEVDNYAPSSTLLTLIEVYKYWLLEADIDGYRIDTVKHMDPGAVRWLCSSLHEFAQTTGKDNFFLLGEITGNRVQAYQTLESTGLDAALGISEIPEKLEATVKGLGDPQEYFSLFRNSLLVQKDSHVWFRNKVVTLYDDHDQVRRGDHKARFAADDPLWQQLEFNALALNVTTLGIPCVYYGSEQSFDGEGGNDRYIREAMFGGEFGAFRSRHRHCFREDHSVYQKLAQLLELRRSSLALRRGRQYLQRISGDGLHFGFPHHIHDRIKSIIAWSRLFDQEHLLVTMNTDVAKATTAWVELPTEQVSFGQTLTCLFSTHSETIGQALTVTDQNDHKCVQLTLPATGFGIWG